MKTGIIVYIVGDEFPILRSDLKAIVKKLRLEADRIEIVSQQLGNFNVHDAWWSLTSKGMQCILCALGKFTSNGHIQLKKQMLRLCG
jgi:hypothetical protein